MTLYQPPARHRARPSAREGTVMPSDLELVNPGCLIDPLRQDEWPAARELLIRLLDRTALGSRFGWTVYVKSGHKHKKALKDGLRFLEEIPSEQQVKFRLRVTGSPIQRDLLLSWERQDHAVGEVLEALRSLSTEKAHPTEENEDEAPTQGSTPPTASALEARLLQAQEGLARLIALHRDMAGLQELMLDAKAREQETWTALKKPQDEYEKLKAEADKLTEDEVALIERRAKLRDELHRIEQRLQQKTADAEIARNVLTAVVTGYGPLKAAHDEAAATLNQLQAQERDLQAQLARVPDPNAVLAAFSPPPPTE